MVFAVIMLLFCAGILGYYWSKDQRAKTDARMAEKLGYVRDWVKDVEPWEIPKKHD